MAMTLVRGVLAAVVVVSMSGAAGCGGGSREEAARPAGAGGGGAAAADPDAPELEILDRFQTLADYVDRSKGHCERLATSIDSWMDANASEVGALIERSRAEPGLDGGHLARVEQRLETVLGGVLDAVEECKGVASVETAFRKLDGWVEST